MIRIHTFSLALVRYEESLSANVMDSLFRAALPNTDAGSGVSSASVACAPLSHTAVLSLFKNKLDAILPSDASGTLSANEQIVTGCV